MAVCIRPRCLSKWFEDPSNGNVVASSEIGRRRKTRSRRRFTAVTGNVSRHVKVDPNEFSESRRVVVLDRFGVSECLHDRIRLQQLRLQLALI